jgi:uncharacterized protein
VVHQLSRTDARRIAVRAQLLDLPRPTDIVEVVRRLTLLQVDHTASVAPSAHLVLWSRLGSTYTRSDLDSLLEDYTLVELQGLIRPSDDMALYTAQMAAWSDGPNGAHDWRESVVRWVEANNACRLDILDLLRSDGPLTKKEIPDTCVVPWRSSGWNNNRNVDRMLDCLMAKGEVAVAGHRGRDRLFDLASRVYPMDESVPLDEAMRIRNERRLKALGIARARSTKVPVEPNDVEESGEPAVIDGVKGQWRVDPDYLDGSFRGRAALLSPFDRLVYDRKRTDELFEFEYAVEMYKPVAQRRWGFFALPVLYGERLVGKLDATYERTEGVLRVDALHRDVDFTPTMTKAVHAEIDALASWLDAEAIFVGAT